MRYFIILVFTSLCLISSSGINIEITNPNQTDIKDAPVVVELDKIRKIGLTKCDRLAVYIDGKQISSQLDDLNNDSIPDEMVFLADLKAGEKKIDMTVRYTLYARHRDVIAEVSASEDIDKLATGVQQIGGGACFQSNQLVGSWGSWYPQPDTVKYARETVGLGLYMPKEYQGKQVMDGGEQSHCFPVKKRHNHTISLYNCG